jgi:hypothetical protein
MLVITYEKAGPELYQLRNSSPIIHFTADIEVTSLAPAYTILQTIKVVPNADLMCRRCGIYSLAVPSLMLFGPTEDRNRRRTVASLKHFTKFTFLGCYILIKLGALGVPVATGPQL